MAKGIYERKGKNGDVTYYIRYQADGTDIKERVGRKSRGFTREMAKGALKSRLGDIAQGHFNLEKVRKPVRSQSWRKNTKSLRHRSATLLWRRSQHGRSRSGRRNRVSG
jgi:hypothetical protein